MKNLARFNFRLLTILIAGIFLGSCQEECDCFPQKKQLLTEKEKTFIPNQPGDTLHFQDNNGQKFFLVCKTKTLAPFTYIPTGHENAPCQSIYETWDRLTANYEGNLLTDNGDSLLLETRLEGGFDFQGPADFRQCRSDYKCSFYLFFKTKQPNTFEHIFYGQTDESLLPLLINFNFIEEKTLSGKTFRKVNVTSASKTCSSSLNYPTLSPNQPGLDSVYYSAQYGLIRLTTIGGKKYQRNL